MKILLLCLIFSYVNGGELQVAHNIIKNYYDVGEHLIRPGNSTQPVMVTIGLTLQDAQLDVKEDVLSTSVWLRVSYTDERLTYEKDLINNASWVVIPVKYVWQPDVTLYNSAEAKLTKIYRDADWPIQVMPDGRVDMILPLDFRSICFGLPFDSLNDLASVHNCSMKFGCWVSNGDEIDLKADDPSMDNIGEHHCSKVLSLKVSRNVVKYECCKTPYVDLTYRIRIELNLSSLRCKDKFN